MISRDHPYFFLARVFATENAEFHLSKYVYDEDSLFDRRKSISVRGHQLTPEWVTWVISSLEPEEELALHSRITIKGHTFHIPMIDFATSEPLAANIADRIRFFLPRKVFLSLAFFDSGRSYHAYSTALLKPKEWLDFMGRLLLINPRGSQEIIDSRWVGHRLIGGYCSLRWSNNTGKYVRSPTSIGIRGERHSQLFGQA